MTEAEFFQSTTLQIVTLFFAILTFTIVPILQRHVSLKIDPNHRLIYEQLAKDAYIKTLIMLISIIAVGGLSIGIRPITPAVTQSMFFICFASAFGAGWTIYKSHNELCSIRDRLNNVALLQEINSKNLKAYTYGLLSALVGFFGLVVVNYVPVDEQPSWLWFLAFILTSFAIGAQRWSDSVSYVVSAQKNLIG